MNNSYEYQNKLIFVEGSEDLYRILLPTGEFTQSGYESFVKYLMANKKPIPKEKEILDNIFDRIGDYKFSKYNHTHTLEWAYKFYRKPLGMSMEDFSKGVSLGKIKPVIDKFIEPTGNDLTRVDGNGNIVCKTYGSGLEGTLNDVGNLIISGRRVNEDELDMAHENTISEEYIDFEFSAAVYPAMENGFYPVTEFIRKYGKSSEPVVELGKNFVSPTLEIVCSDAKGKRTPITSKSSPITFFPATKDFYATNIVIKGPNDVTLSTGYTNAIANYPMLKDSYPEDIGEVELDKITDAITEYGIMYDNGLISERDYNIVLKILGDREDAISRDLKATEDYFTMQ